MEIEGGCHCGRIRYRAEIDPGKVRLCHCQDCQKLSGSPFRVVVAVPENDFSIVTGKPRIYVKISESGNERQQSFCENCGSPIYATSNESEPKKFGIRVRTIDNGDKLIPERQFWTKSAVKWLNKISAITKFERQ